MVNGRIELNSGSICNNIVTGNGGGINIVAGILNMNNGSICNHTTAVNGGGVHMQGGTFNLDGGAIDYNIVTENGGGVNVGGGTFTMTGGSISENRAKNGGGVFSTSVITINDSAATIASNHAYDDGGGIHALNSVNVAGGIIDDNTAEGDGGGVFLASTTAPSSFTGTNITNNEAEGDGGGIFTANHTYLYWLPSTAYSNLTIASNITFAGNQANRLYFGGPGNPTAVPHISASAISSIAGEHILNNYDINYQFAVTDFEFAKWDQVEDPQEGDPLPGATFRVYARIDENCLPSDTEVTPAGIERCCFIFRDEQTSDVNGHIFLDNLIRGYDHFLIETNNPTTFELPDGYWVISVNEAGAITSVIGSHAEMPEFVLDGSTWHVGNQPLDSDFEFIKTEDDGITPLPGAHFNLYRWDADEEEWELMSTVISAPISGVVAFNGLSPGGEYRLRETQAPSGFITPPLNHHHWIITVTSDGEIETPVRHGHAPNFIESGDNFYLPNDPYVPITGIEDNVPLYLMLALVVTLSILVIRLYNVWKQDRELIH